MTARSSIPLGHTIPAHRVFGWCAYCSGRTPAEELAAWQTRELRLMAAEAQQQPPCAECGHPQADHREGDDPVSPGTCATCEAEGSDDAHHDYEAQQQPDTETRPQRGDQFEAWLKAQRDLYDRTDQREESSEFWHEFDRALDEYRLHADTGTPLGEHVCEAQVVGQCECLEQPVPGPGRAADEEHGETRCMCADAGAAFAPAGHYADCPCPEARQQHGPASTAPAAPGDPCS